MKKYVNWSIFAGVGLLLAVGVAIFHYFILPLAIHYQVKKTLALENGTDSWDRFIETPIPIILKLYFFKVENPEEMMRGEKPKVAEVGPYVYREYWKKHDVRVDEDRDSIFYRQGIDFVFDKNMSQGLSEQDNITIINPIIHLLSEVIESFPTVDTLDELLEFGLPELLDDNYGPLMTVNVRRLLFDGVPLPCGRASLGFAARLFCSALQHWAPLPNIYLDPDNNVIVSVLNFKRMGPVYELSRGNKDEATFGKLVTVDGLSEFSYWRCTSANTLDGWDMVMFPPFITKSTDLKVFSSEIMTSIGLQYKSDAEFEGIPGLRLGMDFTFLEDPLKVPEASCYCPGSMKNMTKPHDCYPGKGTLELSSPLGIPAVVTLPHFFQASDNWLSQVDGLNPQPELHESFLDIEPTTGVPMKGYKRVQVNVLTKALPAVRMLKHHANALVPLMWMEEGTSLGPKEIQMLRDQLLTVLKMAHIGEAVLGSVGLLMFVAGVGMAMWRRRQEKNLPDDASED